MEAFPLSVQRLSKAQLKRLAKEFNKSSENRESKEDFAHLLETTLTKTQKSLLMGTVLLAGRTSLSLFQLPTLAEPKAPDVAFKKATTSPQIAHFGDNGDIIENQRLILWAMLDGSVTYLDPGLALQTELEAVVYPSLYDKASHTLQVRANITDARKIARQFARLNGISPESDGLIQRGLQTREEMYALGKLLDAKLVKCSGMKRKSKGFGRVSGSIHETLDDLINTDDYKKHVSETDPVQEDLKFVLNEQEMVLGVAFDSLSVVFRMGANEETIQFVYGCLKQFLQLEGKKPGASATGK